MSTVTRIAIIEEPQEKANVYLDGKLTFVLPIDIASTLHVDQVLSDEEYSKLEAYSDYFTCLASAKRLITNRPHSRLELKTKLKQRKYKVECIDKVLDNLEQIGLVDDQAFANYLVDTRTACHPEGRMLLAKELRGKGIASSIIAEALKAVDEKDAAYNAADRLAEKSANLEYQAFFKKVASFLTRRGFNSEITRQTTQKLWHQYKKENNEEYEYVSD